MTPVARASFINAVALVLDSMTHAPRVTALTKSNVEFAEHSSVNAR